MDLWDPGVSSASLASGPRPFPVSTMSTSCTGTYMSTAETSAEVFAQEVDDFLSFTGAEPPKPNSIFILVMGVTGSGKSTFISRCAGKHVQIGHDLQSCTSNLSIISFQHPDNIHTIYLLDTPGFDDTNRSDIDVLTNITHYLSISYANRIYISGIIFLHRISDNRMSGTTKRNVAMFKELVGDTAYENVAIATTMWWDGEEEMNERKEQELIMGDFRDVLDGGGKIFKHSAGSGPQEDARAREQALDIVAYLIKRAAEGPVVLRVQSEIVDEGKTLEQTAAGKVLLGEVAASKREFERQLLEAKREFAEALQEQDTQAAQALKQLELELLEKERIAAAQSGALNKTLVEMYNREKERLTGKMDEMEAQWRAALQLKEQELRNVEESLQELQTKAEWEANRRAEEEKQRTEVEKLKRAEQEQETRRVAKRQRYRQQELESLIRRAGEARELQEIRQQAEVQRMRIELAELRASLQTKQKATAKIRDGFAGGALKTVVGGLASGILSAAIPAITAGMFCCVM